MNTTKPFELRTESHVRLQFWIENRALYFRHYKVGKRQNAYPADVRTAWCDWVDAAQKGGRMSEALASEVTL